jgi:hypothetical protein
MPLVVNVGLNRKASRDYQSAGVSINLSAELDSGLINDPARLQAEVAKVYAQAQAALEGQVQAMTGVTAVTASEQEVPSLPQPAAPVRGPQHRNGSSNGHGSNGSHAGNGNARNGSYGGPVRLATESQLKALRSICKRMNLRLDHEVHEEFGLESVDELDVRQASTLIDLLKERQGVVQQRRWS